MTPLRRNPPVRTRICHAALPHVLGLHDVHCKCVLVVCFVNCCCCMTDTIPVLGSAEAWRASSCDCTSSLCCSRHANAVKDEKRSAIAVPAPAPRICRAHGSDVPGCRLAGLETSHEQAGLHTCRHTVLGRLHCRLRWPGGRRQLPVYQGSSLLPMFHCCCFCHVCWHCVLLALGYGSLGRSRLRTACCKKHICRGGCAG